VLGWRARSFRIGGHHYAIAVIKGLEPGSVQQYEVALDGEQCWPEPGSPVSPEPTAMTLTTTTCTTIGTPPRRGSRETWPIMASLRCAREVRGIEQITSSSSSSSRTPTVQAFLSCFQPAHDALRAREAHRASKRPRTQRSFVVPFRQESAQVYARQAGIRRRCLGTSCHWGDARFGSDANHRRMRYRHRPPRTKAK